MMNRRYIPRLATLLLLLTGVVILLSWVFDAYGWGITHLQTGEEIRVQSLLSPEGIRWGLRHAVSNFTTYVPLGLLIVASFGLGVAYHSGFMDACVRCTPFRRRGSKPLSRKEWRAFGGTWAFGLFYAAVILFATFSPWSILQGVSGGLIGSSFLEGLPFLLSVGVGVMGMIYGFTSGCYRSDSDLFDGCLSLVKYVGVMAFILFFLSQMLACLDYSGIGRFLQVGYNNLFVG